MSETISERKKNRPSQQANHLLNILEDKPMPTVMQEDKTPKLKTSRQRRSKQASPDIVAA
jgi:hypothetical protein